MLYKFKSRAAAYLILLEPQGRQILEIIGKTPGPTGIVTAAQIPAALAALGSEERRVETAGRSRGAASHEKEKLTGGVFAALPLIAGALGCILYGPMVLGWWQRRVLPRLRAAWAPTGCQEQG